MVENEVKKEFRKELKDLTTKKFNEDNLGNEMLQYIDSRKKDWIKLLTIVQRRIISEFGKESFDKIEDDKPLEQKMITKFNLFTEAIDVYINSAVADHVQKVTDTTKNKIKGIVQRGVAEGLPVKGENSIETLINSLYLDQIIPNRSQTIARTEVVGASNFGSMEGAKQSTPDLLKIWIVTPDGRERKSHALMESYPSIQLNENFAIFNPEKGGTSYGEFPGDPNLPAYEVINCRCAVGYAYKDQKSFKLKI